MTHGISEHEGTVLGVAGRFNNAHKWDAKRWSTQTWVSRSRAAEGYGQPAQMTVKIRFDDQCKNGHNTFSITADVYGTKGRTRDDRFLAGGCMHDEISSVFPELAPLIQWHLTSSDEPMHYIANAVYLAGNRDCYGRAAGEPSSFDHAVRFGNSPLTHRISAEFWRWLQERAAHRSTADGEFMVASCHYKSDPANYSPHYTFIGFRDDDWARAPFKDEAASREWCEALNSGIEVTFDKIATQFSSGKERQLDAARRAAVWPEATDEQLSVEPAELREALAARLPTLTANFKAAMVAAGFKWEPGN